MVQLTARPLPIPEDPDSNPVIGKFYLVSTVLKSFLDKTKIKKKEAKKDKLTSCQFFDHAPSLCTLQSRRSYPLDSTFLLVITQSWNAHSWSWAAIGYRKSHGARLLIYSATIDHRAVVLSQGTHDAQQSN